MKYALLALLALSFLDCGSSPPKPNVLAMPDNPGAIYSSLIFLDKHNQEPTVKGAQVHAYSNPSQQIRASIDKGIQKARDIATKAPYSYQGWPLHPEFHVALFARSRHCQQAGFRIDYDIPPQGLDGSEWDKDPRPARVSICVAGLFQLKSNELAIALVDDPSMIENAAWFEAEHAGLYKVDKDRFVQTALHFEGGGHPINPPPGVEFLPSRYREMGVMDQETGVCLLLTK